MRTSLARFSIYAPLQICIAKSITITSYLKLRCTCTHDCLFINCISETSEARTTKFCEYNLNTTYAQAELSILYLMLIERLWRDLRTLEWAKKFACIFYCYFGFQVYFSPGPNDKCTNVVDELAQQQCFTWKAFAELHWAENMRNDIFLFHLVSFSAETFCTRFTFCDAISAKCTLTFSTFERLEALSTVSMLMYYINYGMRWNCISTSQPSIFVSPVLVAHRVETIANKGRHKLVHA